MMMLLLEAAADHVPVQTEGGVQGAGKEPGLCFAGLTSAVSATDCLLTKFPKRDTNSPKGTDCLQSNQR